MTAREKVAVIVALLGAVAAVTAVVAPNISRNRDLPTTPQAPAPPPLTLTVVVLDNGTGERLPGARIVADELGIATDAGDQGRAEISVPAGLQKVRITVSKQGYRPATDSFTIFEGAPTARIRLDPLGRATGG